MTTNAITVQVKGLFHKRRYGGYTDLYLQQISTFYIKRDFYHCYRTKLGLSVVSLTRDGLSKYGLGNKSIPT